MAKGWNQTELAKAINTKASVIVEIEKGEALYNPEQINMIAKVTGQKIDRGRKKKKPKKKDLFGN